MGQLKASHDDVIQQLQRLYYDTALSANAYQFAALNSLSHHLIFFLAPTIHSHRKQKHHWPSVALRPMRASMSRIAAPLGWTTRSTYFHA